MMQWLKWKGGGVILVYIIPQLFIIYDFHPSTYFESLRPLPVLISIWLSHRLYGLNGFNCYLHQCRIFFIFCFLDSKWNSFFGLTIMCKFLFYCSSVIIFWSSNTAYFFNWKVRLQLRGVACRKCGIASHFGRSKVKDFQCVLLKIIIK